LDICALHEYGLDDIISNRNVIEKSEEKFKFREKFNEALGVKIPEKIEDYTV
jgi:carbamoylphosphate synthase large subunit